jgi:hypothetical protein
MTPLKTYTMLKAANVGFTRHERSSPWCVSAGLDFAVRVYIKKNQAMKISTKAHGVLDYLMGLLLIVSPWLFGFANGGVAQWLPIVLGAMMLVMSLCTNYEAGAVKLISMRTHLGVDLAAGILLAASPWLFGFYEWVYLPHLVLGIAEIGASLLTSRTPYLRHSTTVS